MRSLPSIPHLSSRLRTLALTSPPQTALFYARLYQAILPPTTEDHDCLHILALCLLQVGQIYTALGYVREHADGQTERSQGGHSHGNGKRDTSGCYACAMIVGRCCSQLGRFNEGKAVVERALNKLTPTNLPTLTPANTSATAWLTMGVLSHKGKAPEQAVEAYAKALGEDPWLWEAFTGLCDIGAPPPVDSLFPNPPTIRPASQNSTLPTLSPNPNPMPRSSASEIPGIPSRRQLSPLINGGTGAGLFTPDAGVSSNAAPRLGMMGHANAWETPSAAGDTTFPIITEHPTLPAPSRRPLPNLISAFMPASFRSSSSPTTTPINIDSLPSNKPPAMKRPRGGNIKKPMETPQNGHPHPPRHGGREIKSIEPNGEEAASAVRRSTRLKSTSSSTTSTTTNGLSNKPGYRPPRDGKPARSRSGTSISSASGATVDMASPPAGDIHLQSATDDWLRDIVRRCARAYRSMSIYACQDVIDEINVFPAEIRLTWCFELAARAYYEMANYKDSKAMYESLQGLEPYNIHSMEHFSTLLWHLGDAPRLSQLAQWLISIDRNSPQPWIAAGNCFSLKKNHDEAMRCFRRATQIDPSCAYAWTLCGYEAIEMEEYDRAMAFYRTAIRTDARHYNAWYGMGLVYLKTGKPKYAEHHFRRAAEINPTSPVLLCCIGMVLEQSDDVVQALSFYDQAVRYAPESSMAAYKRIRVLVALQRIDEAISLLEPLSKTAPDEANIHFLLAKCYLRQGQRTEATMSFTAARELQPKLEGAIKVAMGGGDDDDEGEDGDMVD